MDPEAPYQRPASEWREDEEDDEEDGLQMKPCTKNKKQTVGVIVEGGQLTVNQGLHTAKVCRMMKPSTKGEVDRWSV